MSLSDMALGCWVLNNGEKKEKGSRPRKTLGERDGACEVPEQR